MAYAALLPFLALFFCFVVLRIALPYASFIALLVSTVLSGTLFQSSPNQSSSMWNTSLLHTGEFMFEIGLILFGVFFFLEVASKAGITESLAKTVRSVSSDRVVQCMLVIFPLEMMFEGSSGFGTPLLLTAPILMALEFHPILCAILPFVTMMNGVPFGALGTPLRLGFPDHELSQATALLLIPFSWITTFLCYGLILKNVKEVRFQFRHVLWIFVLAAVYSGTSYWVSKAGPEFPALTAGFVTFIFGSFSARFLFKSNSPFFQDRFGILTYAILLASLWIGKQILMDRTIPGFHIRWFNPGIVFALFAVGLHAISKLDSLSDYFYGAAERSKKSLFVLFCMTFTVQQLRNNGGLIQLTEHLPNSLLDSGTPLLGWLGTVFIGTSTVTNMLLSTIVAPIHFPAIAVSSAIGVQLAFQAITAIRSILNESISEKRLFQILAPMSFFFVLILMFIEHIYGNFQ